MYKLITAALLGAALAAPLMAQGYPGDQGRPDRGAGARGDRPDDRRGPPPGRQDDRRGQQDGAQNRVRYQGQVRGQAYRPGQPERGRPGGEWRRQDGGGGPGGGGNRGPGYADRGWDQRWHSDNRYDWRGYRAGHRDQFEGRGYYAPGGHGYRRYERGYRIAPAFYDQRYWILDPYAYRLPPADGPYRWVRYFNDVLLIDLRSGLVVDEVPGFFY